jgi:hypothetical protein
MYFHNIAPPIKHCRQDEKKFTLCQVLLARFSWGSNSMHQAVFAAFGTFYSGGAIFVQKNRQENILLP